jgi:ribonuclease HI
MLDLKEADFSKSLAAAESSSGGEPYQNSRSTVNPRILLASATSNRLGTGVGVSLVGSLHNEAASNDDTTMTTTTTSFGVYFQQHRSLYEREYTALIVALQWLQKKNLQGVPAAGAAMQHQMMTITLPIREDVVYHQLLGDYPVEKESLKSLHNLAVELMQDLPIQLELCPKAALFQPCNDLASRVLLLERSDRDFATFVDPLSRYSSVTSVEEESVETEDAPVLEEFYGGGIIPMLESLDDYDVSLELDTIPDGAYRQKTKGGDPEFLVQESTAARPAIDPDRTYLLQFDGGARGNPHGPSGCGMVIYDDKNNEIWSGGKYLGEHTTNNQAEYTGIVLGLQTANALGIRKLRCQGDSELIIKQLKGQYKVKNEGLKPFHHAAIEAIRRFDVFESDHIFRKDNAVADSLANQAMDSRSSFGL